MYGDTTVIRRLARELREQADEIKDEAIRLVARTEQAEWTGRAAGALRERVAAQSRGLRCCAADHEEAADALDRHAARVERTKELIAAIERRATRLVDAARDRLGDAVDGLVGAVGSALPGAAGDAADRLLAGFEPPPRGHRDWLAVELPGL
jgi:hypothetical protein